ncbi:MAG: helix-turn-helix transcriptional regulator [Clostridia bacterium]|nr:helix-turn-helix transcriptional regulator [Clostridia bacterium]
MDEKYISKRITELRLKKGISEYKMSIDMGHSSSYIHSIASGKALPSMGEFIYMCEYLGVTPKEFFDEEIVHPQILNKLYSLSAKLSEEDISLVLELVERLSK